MPIQSRVNQYRGVNAHFNSYAQNVDDGWSSFHTRYIVALGDVIEANLPSGYELSWETSLQIREDELYYTAIVIYEITGTRIPVARIELLSPSNKPGGSNYEQYIAKQDMALRAGGTSLTVIDFLHQSQSPIAGIRPYPEAGAFPYTITVIDTHPTLKEGQAKIYGFYVDDPMPVIAIPLAGKDAVKADFGAAYTTAYQASRGFYLRADYSQPPMAFETYALADQKRILARMAAVQAAYEQGIDLEMGPF